MINLLDRLKDTGFAIDWTVVGFGWQEKYLTREHVLSYAMDQIGCAPPEQADIVANLAFTDPSDIWTIERLLGELISDAPEAQNRAARVWRWILLDDVINVFSRRVARAETADHTNADFFNYLVDLGSEVDVTLIEFWGDQERLTGESPDIRSTMISQGTSVTASVEQQLLDHTRSMLQMHRAWLTEERIALLRDDRAMVDYGQGDSEGQMQHECMSMNMGAGLKALFSNRETWSGGFYELAIELGPRSDERLQSALASIWASEGLEGCYQRYDIEPSLQLRVPPTLAALQQGHLLGVVTLPNGLQVACGTFAVREDEGIDWIGFYLPMGALGTAYKVGAYPFDDNVSSRDWREPLDEFLRQMAVSVFAVTPFALGLVGHEVSGQVYAEEVQIKGIPKDRWIGYLWPVEDNLHWYPPTRYQADFTFNS